MARLLSVNVGLPRNVSWRGERVFTGVWKEPVQGGRMVRRLNVVGDGQGDLLGHGGEHRAVLVYRMDSYRYWEQQLGRSNFTFGRFGENFTVEGLQDAEVCIGDRYRIGGALFEVTQPCVTCYRVGTRMEEPQMAALLVSHHRPGFYMRVLEECEVGRRDSEGCLWTGARNHSRNRCSVVPARTLTRTVGALLTHTGIESGLEGLTQSITRAGDKSTLHGKRRAHRRRHSASCVARVPVVESCAGGTGKHQRRFFVIRGRG